MRTIISIKGVFTLLSLLLWVNYISAQKILSFSTAKGSNDKSSYVTLLSPKAKLIVNGSTAVIDYHIPNALQSNISLGKRQYTRLQIKGFGYEMEEGCPQIPGYTDFIPINSDKTNLHIFSSNYIEYKGINILPAQNHTLYEIEGDNEITLNPTIYTKDAFFPQNVVTLQDVQDYKGQKYALVRINPVQYNPVTGIVRCYENIKYSIDHVNSDKLSSTTNRDSYTPVVSTKQEKFIVVTSNDYLSCLDDFVRWKTDLGYHVSVLSKSQWIDENEVRDSIKKEYYRDSLKYDAKYLLIVGDFYSVPAKKRILGSDNNYLTDHYYSCMGDSTDIFADIVRGRIPFSIPDSVSSFLCFLKQKELSPSFWSKGVHCSFFEQINKYVEKFNCICFSEELRRYMMNHNYIVDRIYAKESIAIPHKYNATYGSGDSIPSELRIGNFSWSGNAYDIKSALHEGRDYLMYKGHGYPSSFNGLNFGSDYVSLLTDNVCSPLVFCFACMCGQYSEVDNNGVVSMTEKSFVTTFLNKKKFSGIIASSGECITPYVEPFCGGVFSALFNDSIFLPSMNPPSFMFTPFADINQFVQPEMGHMLNIGFNQMIRACGCNSKTQEEMELYHVYGDPSIQFPLGAPVDLCDVEVNRINSDIFIDTHNLDSCTIIFEKKDNNSEVISYKRLENVTGEYVFSDETDYNNIIIKKNNCKPILLNRFSSVYLQNKNISSGETFVGNNISAGWNVTDKTQNGEVVVHNGGSLTLKHSDKTILDKGFKVKIGGKLSIRKQ